jgi:hypothetical protein
MAKAKTRPSAHEDSTLFGVDDGAFHHRELFWQHIGRFTLALFIAAGLLGVFGSGPLSNAVARSPDGLAQIEYERATRAQASTVLRLQVSSKRALGGVLDVWMDRQFVDGIRLDQIMPEPERSWSGPQRFEFEIPALRDTVVTITVHYRPQEIGMTEATLGVANGAPIRFKQFVFP